MWQKAIQLFLTEMSSVRAANTVKFYTAELRTLGVWCEAQKIPLKDFRKSHFTEYLSQRGQTVSRATIRHDITCARRFLKWAVRQKYLAYNPLRDMEAPRPPKPYIKCPSSEEVKRLLDAIPQKWNPKQNPKARWNPPEYRKFFAVRDACILAGLVDSGCRIGEMLALKVQDVRDTTITFRTTKGKEPRVVPVSPQWLTMVEKWMKLRPEQSPSDTLFVTQYGEPVHADVFIHAFRSYQKYAGVSGFTMHGLRHYAITGLAQVDLLGAARIAGHKDLRVTQGYLHDSQEHMMDVHRQTNLLGKVMPTRKRLI